MLHTIVYQPHEPGIILVKLQGPLTLAEVRQVMAEVLRLASEHQCFRVLSDAQELDLKLSMGDVYYLPDMFAELGSNLGLFVRKFKRAILTAPNDEILKFFETVAKNRGQNVKLFQAEEPARQWLLDA